MSNLDFDQYRIAHIQTEGTSRGTGAPVALHEAVVYDFMPPILGNQFRVNEQLRHATHFYGQTGSFMMRDEAYGKLAVKELEAGNLTEALEAYKRRLSAATGFISAMADVQSNALLSPEEVDRLQLDQSFGPIERRLVQAVTATGGDSKIDMLDFAAWVAGVRGLERDAFSLSQAFSGLKPNYPLNTFPVGDPRRFERDTSLKDDLATGTKLRDAYAQMQHYRLAAWISKKIGDEEGLATYTKLAETEPQENPNFEPIMDKIRDAYDR